MTKTLQDKIDKSANCGCCGNPHIIEVNKAIQELREEIMILSIAGWYSDKYNEQYILRKSVLSLIGEKKLPI